MSEGSVVVESGMGAIDRSFGTPAASETPRATRLAGVIGSLALHLLVLALVILGLPHLLRAPVELPSALPVELVRLGPETRSPAAETKAALPQQPARETVPIVSQEAVPAPAVPPPEPAREKPRVPEPSRARPLAAVTKAEKPELPRAHAAPRADPSPAPAPKVAPTETLEAQLRSLALLQQQQAREPPSPRTQEGSGASNVAAASAAPRGAEASYGIKDFIRAQIERRWHPDLSAPLPADTTVSVRVTLKRDGSVTGAEIVDDPRMRTSAAFRELAYSARNAVLISSPLDLPPGRYDEVRDLVLDFSPGRALR